MSVNSILSFNASTTNRKQLSEITEPFQIMPSARAKLTSRTIQSFSETNNSKILIHVNYLTYVFNDSAVENNSPGRKSLQMYNQLADTIHTKHILIHLPKSVSEMTNLENGLLVIHDELIRNNKIVHLEIPAWTKEFMIKYNIQKRKPIDVITEYMDIILDKLSAFPKGSFRIVFDTAHMWSNGCHATDMVEIMKKYEKYIMFIHLNGNLKGQYVMDTHCPIFSPSNKFIKEIDTLCNYIASKPFISIAEVTHSGSTWDEWNKFASDYGFSLVSESKAYSI